MAREIRPEADPYFDDVGVPVEIPERIERARLAEHSAEVPGAGGIAHRGGVGGVRGEVVEVQRRLVTPRRHLLGVRLVPLLDPHGGDPTFATGSTSGEAMQLSDETDKAARSSSAIKPEHIPGLARRGRGFRAHR